MSKKILNQFIPVIDFLANAFGENVEFVLHDLSESNSTIIAIRNGHVTGRKKGDSLSNFTLRILKEQIKTDKDFEDFCKKAIYKKNIKSANYLIRNDEGNPIGMLCINYNISMFLEMKDFIEKIIGNSNLTKSEQTSGETNGNASSFNEISSNIINGVLDEYSIPPERMIPEEKMEIVSKMNEKGVFQLKGVVSEVALKLCVSEATIYRYLNNNIK